MRVLHVAETFLPRLGGIEVQLGGLATAQAVAGHHVTVLTRTRATAGVPITDPAQYAVLRDGQVGNAIARARPDVVHIHVSGWSRLTIQAAQVARAFGLPVLVTVHSMWTGLWPEARAGLALTGLSREHIQWSAVSSVAAGPVRRALHSPADVLIVPNAVDTDTWQRPRSRRIGPANEVTIVSVMRMTRRKRPLPLLRILHRVRAHVRADLKLRVVLVGDGPQLNVARAWAEAHDMSSWVKLPGAMTHHDIRRLYEQAQIFVSPARLESFGIAALEARTAGLVVVARCGTGIEDFIEHGRQGFLADSDAAMADRLVALVSNPSSLSSVTARNAASRPAYAWTDTVARTDGAYAQAIRVARGGPSCGHEARPNPCTTASPTG